MKEEDSFSEEIKRIKGEVNGKTFKPIDAPYYEPTPTEKEVISDWNKNPENKKYKVVKRSRHYFWKFLAIFWTLIILGSIGYLAWSGDWEYLQPIFNSNTENTFNNDFNVNNQYDFNPDTENFFENDFDITLKLDKEAVDRICG